MEWIISLIMTTPAAAAAATGKWLWQFSDAETMAEQTHVSEIGCRVVGDGGSFNSAERLSVKIQVALHDHYCCLLSSPLLQQGFIVLLLLNVVAPNSRYRRVSCVVCRVCGSS